MLELNRIYNGDCLEVMKEIDNNFVDLTVTSPPYDTLKDYNGYIFNFNKVAEELFRVTNFGGVVVWIVGDETINGDETGTSFNQALRFKEIGFNLHDTMIWHKPNSFNFGSNNCYRNSFEYMFVFSKGKIKTINLIKDVATKSAGMTLKGARKHRNGDRDEVPDFTVGSFKKRDNVWDINVGTKNYNHPAIFPDKLARDHIFSWTNKGDVVLDPMCGSSTTCSMAKMLGRNYIGIDICKDYCDIAKKRVLSIPLILEFD
jgi:site-specific DNA-methyltransferase (adenine-specific)